MLRLFAVMERNPYMRCVPSQFLNAYNFEVKVLLLR